MPEMRRHIVRVLKKFDFISKPGRGDHTKYSKMMEVGNMRIKIRTQVDSEKEIPTGTFHAILKQIRLASSRYPEALRCPYTIRDYERDITK